MKLLVIGLSLSLLIAAGHAKAAEQEADAEVDVQVGEKIADMDDEKVPGTGDIDIKVRETNAMCVGACNKH